MSSPGNDDAVPSGYTLFGLIEHHGPPGPNLVSTLAFAPVGTAEPAQPDAGATPAG